MNEACGFRVGDCVELVVDLTIFENSPEAGYFRNRCLPQGMTGVVKDIDNFDVLGSIGVAWDIESQQPFHDCNGTCKKWHRLVRQARVHPPPAVFGRQHRVPIALIHRKES